MIPPAVLEILHTVQACRPRFANVVVPMMLTKTTSDRYQECRLVRLVYESNGVVNDENLGLWSLRHQAGGELFVSDAFDAHQPVDRIDVYNVKTTRHIYVASWPREAYVDPVTWTQQYVTVHVPEPASINIHTRVKSVDTTIVIPTYVDNH